MSGSLRSVAAQAIGVAILVAIVYLAFLRPDSPTELSGIHARDGSGAVVAEKPAKKSRRAKHGRGTGRIGRRHGGRRSRPAVRRASARRRGGRAGSAAASAGAGSSSGGSAVAIPVGGPTGTPPGNQYTDSVSAIRAKLRGTG